MASSDQPSSPESFVVSDEDQGTRLDALLAAKYTQHSRVRLRQAITAGTVLVDNRRAKPAYRVVPGQEITLTLPERPREGPQPEEIPLSILYEDDQMAAIDKPSGMVVHPAKGHWSGTLTAALAWHFQNLSGVGGPTRPGIVHRLDRETSGVIVVAKTDEAHLGLARQFEERTTQKEYLAVVAGVPSRDRDRISQPIGSHPYQREKMAIRMDHATSRDAETFYEVEERFARHALVRVLPKTGRTHQIRVHLAHVGTPVLCDRLYGGRSTISRGELQNGRADDQPVLSRLALHAQRLRIAHPTTGEPLDLAAPVPEDLQQLLATLRELAK